MHWYLTPLWGDVTAIIDSEGTLMGSYVYDAWGKVEEENCLYNGNGVNIIEINPIRYRGYYYDEESGFYYLNMRYYDSAMKRWINVDSEENIGSEGTFASLNAFVYCINNPTDKMDNTVASLCHQFSAPFRENKKYVNPDGHFEVIYDRYGYIVLDPRDQESYNYFSPTKHPIMHAVFDVYPWILYGNSELDTTTPIDRIFACFGMY